MDSRKCLVLATIIFLLDRGSSSSSCRRKVPEKPVRRPRHLGSVNVGTRHSEFDARSFGNCFNATELRFPDSDLISTDLFTSGPDLLRSLSSTGNRYLPDEDLKIKRWIDQLVLESWENEVSGPGWDRNEAGEDEFKFVEPMVFDLVRGLGAKPGESEVNYLMVIPLNGDQVTTQDLNQ